MKLILIICLFLSLPSYAKFSIEITAPHAPGGPSDIIARIVQKNLISDDYFINYRPGAGTLQAISHVKNTESILVSTFIQTFVTNPLIFSNLNYHPTNDLIVIGTIGIMPSMLICNSKLNFKHFNDFKNYQKNLNFGIAGYGSTEHISTEILFESIGKRHTLIPYSRGGTEALAQVLGGHLDCIFSNYPTIKSQVHHKNISKLIVTHKVDIDVLTWDDYFRSEFPISSIIGLVVSSAAEDKFKDKIRNDFLKMSLNNISNDLIAVGFFPFVDFSKNVNLSTDKRNQKILKYLIDKKIKLIAD
jgi:tripartite-type tricarboxylate transporter receptor subunit TctC